jgi:AcrR family transcriptional regulator
MAGKKGKGQGSKSALLDAAWTLLLEGAGGMSVEAIVARAGLSKGTFFHFFPAKQDLLDALCARIAEESSQHATSVLQRRDLDPVARLDLFLQESRVWRSERSKALAGLWWELARDENAALMSKVRAFSIARLAPAMTRLLVEARNLGCMQVTDEEVVARLVVEWMSTTVEGTLRLLAEKRDAGAVDLALRRANSTLSAIERVLGVAEGSFRRVDRRVVAKLAADVPRTGESGKGDDGGPVPEPRRRVRSRLREGRR